MGRHMYEAKLSGGQFKYTPDELERLWEKYKLKCDSNAKRRQKTVWTVGDDGAEHKEVVRWEELSPLTYTREGFCAYIKLSVSCWANYAKNEGYADIAEMIDAECKINVRERFEDGTLNTRLAGIWLGRYPEYRTQQETTVNGGIPVVISGEGELSD